MGAPAFPFALYGARHPETLARFGQAAQKAASVEEELLAQIAQQGAPTPRTLERYYEARGARDVVPFTFENPIERAGPETVKSISGIIQDLMEPRPIKTETGERPEDEEEFTARITGTAKRYGLDPSTISDTLTIRKKIYEEENKRVLTQLATLDEVKAMYPPIEEIGRGGARGNKKVLEFVWDWVETRKALLMAPREAGGRYMTPESAHYKAINDAKVVFPFLTSQDITEATVLGSRSKGPPQLPSSAKFGTEISPQRAVQLSPERQVEILRDPGFTENAYSIARDYRAKAGGSARLDSFLRYVQRSLQASGRTAAEAAQDISDDAQHLSMAAALVGLF